VFQRVAVGCSVLQCSSFGSIWGLRRVSHDESALGSRVLQCVAVCCKVLQINMISQLLVASLKKSPLGTNVNVYVCVYVCVCACVYMCVCLYVRARAVVVCVSLPVSLSLIVSGVQIDYVHMIMTHARAHTRTHTHAHTHPQCR